MNILRQSTAVDVLIGPFLDITDGVTAETGETPAIKLSKGGQTLGAKSDATVPVHDADGYHNCELDATDTATIGLLVLTAVGTATALPIRHEYQVMDSLAFDTLYADSPTLITPADVGLIYESVITTTTTESELIMATAFPVDDSWVGLVATLEDKSTGMVYSGNVWISDAVQATETLHLSEVFPVTIEDGVDVLRIMAIQHPRYALNAYAPSTAAALSSALSSILAKLLAYVRLLARSDAAPTTDDSTELSEINSDGGSGAGTFAKEDSAQAVADNVVLVKVPTDKLTFTIANEVDANAKSMNDASIVGDGTAGDKWRDV